VARVSNGSTTFRSGLLKAIRVDVSRDELFGGLYIIGCVNGLFGRILLAAKSDSPYGVLTVDISVIVLFACFAGISLIFQNNKDELRPLDLAVATIFTLLVALPMFALSWVAVTGLSLYILVFADDRGKRRRGALILLALSVSMFWSRLLFQFFAGPILEIDAAFVASMLGTARSGNLVGMGDGSGTLMLIPECSSFTNVSLGFLCLVTVTQWVGHRWSAIDVGWTIFACGMIVGINTARMAVTGASKANYELIHSSWGATIFGMVIILVTFGISALSARRELFTR